MQDKTTGDLKREMGEQPNLDAYLRENGSQFVDRSIGDLLDALYETKAVSKASLARRAGMSEVYLHQVFSAGGSPPGTGCCASASVWGPLWRRRSACSNGRRMPLCIPGSGGTPLSPTELSTGWSWRRSMKRFS